jgi:hypothetical protein
MEDEKCNEKYCNNEGENIFNIISIWNDVKV